tara:strand:+ start:563 stop:1213 length:651 start_codon:yes stop_codon:yes gene_type:complete
MLNDIIDQLKETDFSGTDGLLSLIALLFPVFAVLFFSVQKIIFKRSVWGTYQRRLIGMLWRKKHARRRTARKPRAFSPNLWLLLAILIFTATIIQPIYDAYLTASGEEDTINCYRPYITDGDTLKCNGERIRLYSIDAPEMEGHCREGRQCVDGDPYASKDYLISLTRSQVTCTPIEKDHYGRTVATCESEQSEDLSCDMVEAGHAILRYGNLSCD